MKKTAIPTLSIAIPSPEACKNGPNKGGVPGNNRRSRRFIFSLIGFSSVLMIGVAKHWLTGIDNTIVALAAGIATAYITGETVRASKKEN